MEIAPSLFNSDSSQIKETLHLLEKEEINYLHIDVMDGSFVPDMAFGPKQIKDIRQLTKLLFDVHLMIERPEKIVNKFIEAGADCITFHIEATNHGMKVIQEIKKKGKKVGVAINPATPVDYLIPILSVVDQVLVMTINPGTENDYFIEETLIKISQLKKIKTINEYEYSIEVDGKISELYLKKCAEAGADLFVSGGFIFNTEFSPKVQLAKLKSALIESENKK